MRRRADRALTGAERDVWLKAMDDVRPLAGRAAAGEPPRPAPDPLPPDPPAPVDAARAAPSPDPVRPPPPGRPDGDTFVAEVDGSWQADLRRGRLEVDARLDLHGLHREAAHVAVHRFLERAAAGGLRVVLVITGTGARHHGSDSRGILRRDLPMWLAADRLRPVVLAWHPAARHHGGDGAFYVVLRRRRPPAGAGVRRPPPAFPF